MKTIMTMLTLGASVAVMNASLVRDKIADNGGGDGRDTAAELVMIPGEHEGMIASHEVVRMGVIAIPESIRTFAEKPFDRSPEPISTVPELIAISDMHDRMTVSQVAAQAASITVPEPATIFAVAPLLLPFFAGTLRILRQNKMAKQIA
jgi:hypothetical protein